MRSNYETYKTDVIKRYIDVKFGESKDQEKNMDELYRYIRSIQNDYFVDGNLSDDFKYLTRYLKKAEEDLPRGFIIESSPRNNHEFNSDEEEKIKYIIYNVRSKLLSDNINNPLIDMCSYSSNLVSRYAGQSDLNTRRVVIYPGFTKQHNLLHFGSGYHAFNIITINNKKYIVDLTYRQFFLKDRNSLERIGVCSLFNTMPGRFMTLNDSRMKTATKLLKDGYVEMTDENMKNYFDGFALSYRNATYYDETDDFSFTTNYSPYDYMRFINEEDSQLNHEGIDRLGYQKKVLRNPNIRFTK